LLEAIFFQQSELSVLDSRERAITPLGEKMVLVAENTLFVVAHLVDQTTRLVPKLACFQSQQRRFNECEQALNPN